MATPDKKGDEKSRGSQLSAESANSSGSLVDEPLAPGVSRSVEFADNDNANGSFNRRHFYRDCNWKSANELSDCGVPSVGKTGTFRAQAVARRYVNSSRRNLLKTSQGVSVQSLLSNLTRDSPAVSERTPLNELPVRELPVLESGKNLYSTISSSSLKMSSSSERVKDEKKSENIWINFVVIWIGKPISALLLFLPFAYAAHQRNWSATWIFWLNFLAMIPLASILGDFTEEAALHTNDVIGGLLNASFGNAVEVVVAIQALMRDEIRVVQASMIGSIFSNLLLVLGCCFLFGGMCYKEQSFSPLSAAAGMGLLALSSIAMVLPTPFAEYYEINDESVLIISRASACFMLFSYMLLLYFQLFTHKDSFGSDDNNSEGNGDGEDEEEEATVPFWMALVGLGLTTALVTIFSDFLVASIDQFCTESGISQTFVGLIILPIVGNAVEHITAVSVAMKNKMDLALGVAIGSCTQIALFVVPVTVIFGWFAGKPMTLNYPRYEIGLYIISIFTVSVCLGTGKSNWLLGSVIVITYIMVAIGFWFEKVEKF